MHEIENCRNKKNRASKNKTKMFKTLPREKNHKIGSSDRGMGYRISKTVASHQSHVNSTQADGGVRAVRPHQLPVNMTNMLLLYSHGY